MRIQWIPSQLELKSDGWSFELLASQGLSMQERSNPYDKLRGPSLLTRDKFGAKKVGKQGYTLKTAPAHCYPASRRTAPSLDPGSDWIPPSQLCNRRLTAV